MAVRTRIDPIDRDIQLMISQELSPQAQARVFAQLAGQQIAEAKATNRRVLGRDPRLKVTVDGKEGAPLSSVRPNGVVVAEFELLTDVLAWIGEQLVLHSPIKSGRYSRSHTLLADGTEIELGAVIPEANTFTFVNSQPYARKIERGASSEAPDGVYQAVATMASRRFGNIAKIRFTYASLLGGRATKSSRQPAVTVSVG